MSKIIFSQRVNRHIVKMLDLSYNFEKAFGIWQTPQSDLTSLNCPIGITKDNLNNIYVCDSNNKRIVKLDSSLVFVGTYDFSNYGEPHQILFENDNIYIVGVYKNIHLSIVKTTKDLIEVKGNKNIYTTVNDKPWGICKAFETDTFLISIGKKLLKVIESDETNFIIKTDVLQENVTNKDNTEVTHHEAITKEKKYTVKNFPVLPSSYTFWRRYTETLTAIENSATEFQTKHFPLLETPGHNPINSIVVYKNEVELDYDSNLDDNNDYYINQSTGLITLAKPVIDSDVIRIRYKYQMIENVDYTFDIMFGKLLLTEGVTEDHNGNRDIIESNYSYTLPCEEPIITGISEDSPIITGLLHHTNGDIYLIQNTFSDYAKISRINSSYYNIGDSNKISKFATCICERTDGSLLTYDSSNQKIVCYSDNLNFVEEVYIDNFVKEEPPTLVSDHNYKLDSFPILNKSEKIFTNFEVLPLEQYSLSYEDGSLTILPITEEQVKILIYGKNYQLNYFQIVENSEKIYVNNDLRPNNSYILDYSTGILTFPDPSNFQVFPSNSDPTQDISTNIICKVGDIVRFTANILPIPLQINTDYYVVYQDGTKIKISETQDGTPITLTKPIKVPPLGVLQGKVFYKLNGNIKATYYRDIEITKVEYKTGLDIVDFETFNIPETLSIEIPTDFPYKVGEIINFQEKTLEDLPAPLIKDTDYYIVEILEKTGISPRHIKISDTLGGSAITLTSAGFGQIVYKYSGPLEKIENDAYDINSISELNI